MMMLHQMEEQAAADGETSEKPSGPRVSEVSEVARRLGEIHTLLEYVIRAVIVASPKSKGGSLGKVDPYPRPVMIDGATGDWVGKPSATQQKKKYDQLLSLADQAAERWKAAHGE